MGEKKLLTYEGLEEYNIKWHERLQEIAISDADINAVAFESLGADILEIPDEWTVSSNGTLNLSASNAYSYWPEGAGTKNIVISNPSARDSFWLKLTDGGNFILNWDSSIEWENDEEPNLNSFTEDIFFFKTNNNGVTWKAICIKSENITPYWKFSIDAQTRTSSYELSIGDYGHTAFVQFCGLKYGATIDWGDGIVEFYAMNDLNLTTLYGNRQHEFPKHTYQSDGIYQIKIEYSDFENTYIYNWDSADNTVDGGLYYLCTENIYSIDSPLPHLKGSWLDCSTSPHTEDDSFSEIFYSCTNLISIPEKLFWNNSNLKWINNAFNDTKINNPILYFSSPNIDSIDDFPSPATVFVPSGSTTQTTFNNVASSLGLTIIEV